MIKKCTKCKVEKDTSEFSKDKRAKDGLLSKCKACFKAYYDSKKEQILGQQKSYYKANKKKTISTTRKWREANREQYLANCKEYREANKGQISSYHKGYRANNLGKFRANTARYRASKMQRTPPWSETREIAWFYEHCPEGMHVDHKYPLQGKTVSGLHCFANLQYLSESDNQSKGNRV